MTSDCNVASLMIARNWSLAGAWYLTVPSANHVFQQILTSCC